MDLYLYSRGMVVLVYQLRGGDVSVQDLHRTGSSTFSGEDNDDDRAMLQRVLLAYARWNNKVGYCQGFNVIAAVILDVMDRQEDCALKV